jgi:EmrB/QacA subfamily drug resistance transporter
MAEVSTQDTSEPLEGAEVQFSRRRMIIIIAGLLLAMALGALDQTIVATALPTVVGDLHGLDEVSWVFTAYILAAGVSTPLYGKLADMYGTSRLYIFALSTFLIGSAASGAAQSMAQLIAARAVQGLGAGGLMVLTLTIIAQIVPFRERGRFQGLYGAVLGIASLGGPFIGGIFTDRLSWRWIFYVNLPLGVAALVIMLLALRLPQRAAAHRPDYLGFVILAAFIICITLVTSWGGVKYSWSSPVIIGLIVAAVVALAVFVPLERAVPEPIIPLQLFRIPTITLACVASMFVFTAVNTISTFGSVYMQLASGLSATHTGVLMLPTLGGTILSSVLGGNLITKTARYKWSPPLGAALMVVSLLLLSTLKPSTSLFLLAGYLALFGFGLGFVIQPLVVGVQVTAPTKDLATATATIAFSQRIGGAIGLATFGAFFSRRLTSELSKHLPASVAKHIAPGGSIAPTTIDALAKPIRHELQAAYSATLTTVFMGVGILMVVAFLLATRLKNVKLDDSVKLDDLPPTI